MRQLVLILICLTVQVYIQAQGNAEKALQNLDENYPQEKIHLFFNKESFVAGETIWFKAYLFSGYVQSLISATVYVELYNEKKELLDKISVPLVNASGQGSLQLNNSLQEGVYFIRAYTKWMLNFDESFQYLWSFPLYNPASAKMLSKPQVQWTANAFPESGTLLPGIENKVAIRISAAPLPPRNWTGYLTEKDKPEKITSFSSFNSQIGSFSFIPQEDKQYQIHLSDNSSNTTIIPLLPSKTGAVIKTKLTGERLAVEMHFRGRADGGLNYKVLAHMQGQLVYSGVITKKDPQYRIVLPVGKLMNGMLHLTLFDENEAAVAERIVFIKIDPLPGAIVNTVMIDTKSRALNELELMADTNQLLTYAVAVMDEGVSQPRTRSLYSDLWLGDLSESIDNPAWYFAAEDSFRMAALDALLMTEKWKRFDWQSVVQNKFPVITHQPEKYLSYSGIATRNGKPVSEESLNLIARFSDASTQFTQVKTDKTGKFMLQDVAFYDTVIVYAGTNATKGKAKEITLRMEGENRFYPIKRNFPQTSFTLVNRKEGELPSIVANTVKALNNQKVIDTRYKEMEAIRIEARVKSAKEKLNESLSTPLFQTQDETLFDFVNEDHSIQSYTNIFDWLDGRVAGLNFTIEDGIRIPMMRGVQANIFVDEIAMDLDMIYTLPVNDIAMVKVIKGYFIGATSGGGGSGVIAIYTKRAGMNRSNSPSLSLVKLAGYRTPAVYSSPEFSSETGRMIKNDTRPVLSWAPLLQHNKGKSTIRFYNNDIASAYRIIITGFTQDAKPVYVENIIQGKK